MIDLPLSVPTIAVYDDTGGLLFVGPDGTQGAGAGWSLLPPGYDDATHAWSTEAKAMVEDAAKVEGLLVAEVKAEAERQRALSTSPGEFKQAEYAAKRAEVVAWDMLGTTAAAILTAFNGLSAVRRETRFAYAIADAAAFGDNPAAAITRFRAGITAAAAKVGAIEARACALIRAADTAEAKRAAAASAAWPT
ncbi:hypothetical protein [Sphingomonas endolithica]|uniref:hypothetical protein n=1 Tax=Sphingomonas endolithica TaxID=2972485 RepID=UPI0021AED88D|nr:hypothetical protein [Sphingomonas sp. ZFBP2030]